jgi:hypothetical protein
MVLTALTIVSFALAAVFGVIAWRLRHAERLRSEARVTALAAAIEGNAVALNPEGHVSTAPAMFTQTRQSVVQGRPLLKLAIGFTFAVAVIVLIAMTGDRHESASEAVAASPTDVASTPSTGASGTLELVSMRHERRDDALTVTGLVRNTSGTTPDSLTAVVFAFDRDGNYVASGRAALEFPRLAAGDESPFRVTVADVKDVGRYRVSFRTDAGVVRLLDRRPAIAAAAAGRSGLQVSAN